MKAKREKIINVQFNCQKISAALHWQVPSVVWKLKANPVSFPPQEV